MAKYKNMTNRPMPIELVGRSLSVGARKEFEVLPGEMSAQLRSRIGKEVRLIEPDPPPVDISTSEREQVRKPVRPMFGRYVPRDESTKPVPMPVEPEPIPILSKEEGSDKTENKGDDSLTTGDELVDPEGEAKVPPTGTRGKKDRDHKSRDKGGR